MSALQDAVSNIKPIPAPAFLCTDGTNSEFAGSLEDALMQSCAHATTLRCGAGCEALAPLFAPRKSSEAEHLELTANPLVYPCIQAGILG